MGSPTIPGAAEGFNGKLSASGYGSRLVRVVGIAQGPTFENQEAEAASRRVLYPLSNDDGDFQLAMAFLTWDEREAFNSWVRGYLLRVTTNQRVSGYMLVQVPARHFSRVGVPVGPLSYGDQVGTLAYPSTVRFIGTIDPTSAVGKTTTAGSRFVAPSKDSSALAYYPSGTQASGASSLEGTFFDPTPAAAAGVGEVVPYADITSPTPNGPGRE
jgi:hypothetical protein